MLTEADSLKTMMKIDENTQTRTQIAFVCSVYAMFTNTNPPTYTVTISSSLVVVNRCMSHLVMGESQPAAHICPGF